MSPRVEDRPACRHCRAPLPAPPPRVCPECGGSLQKRFLSCGCLSSAPLAVALGLAAAWLASGRVDRPADGALEPAPPAEAAEAEGPDARSAAPGRAEPRVAIEGRNT